MIRAAIFDLDGTLVDSLPGIAMALDRALESLGQATHPEETVRGFVGDGTRILSTRALPEGAPDALISKVETAFFENYADTWRPGTTKFPGIDDLLEELHARALPLAVFSNKPHVFTEEIVHHLFPPDTFEVVLGHREGAARKPDPEGALAIARDLAVSPAAAAFIGDSTIDFETARRAGMTPLLVDWGFHSREALAATGAPLVSTPAGLLPHLPAPGRGA